MIGFGWQHRREPAWVSLQLQGLRGVSRKQLLDGRGSRKSLLPVGVAFI